MTVSVLCFIEPMIRQECKFTATLSEGVRRGFGMDKARSRTCRNLLNDTVFS